MKLSRRLACAAALSAAASPLLPPGIGTPPGRYGLLTALFGDLAAARALGRAYLASGADRTAALARTAALLDGVRDLPELRARLRVLADAELARGEVALVDGWVLAPSEAGMMALAAAAASGLA